MTGQLPDVLVVDGEERLLLSNPLTAWMEANPGVLRFVSPHTACWRGYVATFALRGDELWLVRVEGWTVDPVEPGPGAPDRPHDPFGPPAGPVVEVVLDHLGDDPLPVRADWYDGVVRVASGPVVHFVHMGYESRYEHEELWTVQHGIVSGRAPLPIQDPGDDPTGW